MIRETARWSLQTAYRYAKARANSSHETFYVCSVIEDGFRDFYAISQKAADAVDQANIVATVHPN